MGALGTHTNPSLPLYLHRGYIWRHQWLKEGREEGRKAAEQSRADWQWQWQCQRLSPSCRAAAEGGEFMSAGCIILFALWSHFRCIECFHLNPTAPHMPAMRHSHHHSIARKPRPQPYLTKRESERKGNIVCGGWMPSQWLYCKCVVFHAL